MRWARSGRGSHAWLRLGDDGIALVASSLDAAHVKELDDALAAHKAELAPAVQGGRTLDRVPLRPTLVTGRLAEARATLDALWRVAQSLNPDLVLRRGYARVEADGHVVDSAHKAREVGAMRLIFADGEVDVVTTDASPPPSRPKPRPPRDPSLQPQLF